MDVKRIERYNITYKTNTPNEFLEKGIPVFWGEHGGEAKESDIDKLKKKVIKHNCVYNGYYNYVEFEVCYTTL